MTTTIPIQTIDYQRAKAYADKRHTSVSQLFSEFVLSLIQQEEEDKWNEADSRMPPYTIEELSARIDEGEAEFERGEYVTHEQMMKEIEEEFPWLR